MNEGGKVSPVLLFSAAFILFVAAIVLYLVKEDSAFNKVAAGVSEQNQHTASVLRENKDLRVSIDTMLEWQKTQIEMNDKFMQRLQLIEMRLDSQPKVTNVKHTDAPMPQPLKVELTTPIKVIYREARPVQPPTLPKGKANGQSTRK